MSGRGRKIPCYRAVKPHYLTSKSGVFRQKERNLSPFSTRTKKEQFTRVSGRDQNPKIGIGAQFGLIFPPFLKPRFTGLPGGQQAVFSIFQFRNPGIQITDGAAGKGPDEPAPAHVRKRAFVRPPGADILAGPGVPRQIPGSRPHSLIPFIHEGGYVPAKAVIECREKSQKCAGNKGIKRKPKNQIMCQDARSRSRDRKFDAKTLNFFLDFQTKSDLKLFVTQHK